MPPRDIFGQTRRIEMSRIPEEVDRMLVWAKKQERERIIKRVDRIIYDLACYDPELFDPADLIKTTQSVIQQWQTLKGEK